MSLIARHLEGNGIPTVIMGAAKDIVEHVGVPRFLFSDFPLGNPCGRPNDPESQTLTAGMAIELLASASAPRTTVQSPIAWSEDPSWKLDYSNVERLSPQEIERRRAQFDADKLVARQRRSEDGLGGHAG